MDAQGFSFFLSFLSDINECADENGGCEGTCCNTIGSYYCRCPDGSKLGDDGKSCQGKHTLTSEFLKTINLSIIRVTRLKQTFEKGAHIINI